MDATILRSDVYKLIHSGQAFDMQFVTCNRKKGTGGELMTCEGWMVLHGKEQEGKEQDGEEDISAEDDLSEYLADSKDPNHEENGTVNVFNPANSGYHPVKVHYDLITTFNGKRVIN